MEVPYISRDRDFRCLAVDSIVARVIVLWNYKHFDFTESYFTIHSLILCTIKFLYACKVLKTFNRHLNLKREFTMITEKTWRDHFDVVYGSSILSSLLFTLDMMCSTEVLSRYTYDLIFRHLLLIIIIIRMILLTLVIALNINISVYVLCIYICWMYLLCLL